MEMKPYLRVANYYETDQMGIIHHSNYIRWFEEARIDFMNQMGYPYRKSAENGIEFAVLSVACEYKSMVRFGDTVSIRTWIPLLTPSRMTISYELRELATGTLCATGESRHCYYDGARGRPVSLKKALPDLYARFEGVCGS